MKRAPRSLQHHVLYRKYNGQDSEISALLGKCGFKDGKYRSDLIVFDWEYGDDVDQIEELRFILENSHAYVVIFTGADKDADIRAVLADDLREFAGRVELLDKEAGGESQHGRLVELLETQQASNFAFKFGTSLRASVYRSLDSVLHKLSALNLDKVVRVLATQDNDPINADLKEMIGEKLKEKIKADEGFAKLIQSGSITEAASTEILEIVSEVIKTDLASVGLEHTSDNATDLEEGDHEIMEHLWSYRLYHNPADTVVRSGDILQSNDGGEDTLYLVLTPPCDLAQFWNKTDGKLAVVKLELLPPENEELRQRALLFKKSAGTQRVED
ncbi:hypothetical protein ACM25N_13810 [Roseovarius sp. C7]|uniref:hypothetical protein n=1 Tax=Roseovarius sp. C7 TaxID=3398643 RepID=UPI0039F6EF3F